MKMSLNCPVRLLEAAHSITAFSVVLSHCIKRSESYANAVSRIVSYGDVILDNGFFENGVSSSLEELAEMAEQYGISKVVLPDGEGFDNIASTIKMFGKGTTCYLVPRTLEEFIKGAILVRNNPSKLKIAVSNLHAYEDRRRRGKIAEAFSHKNRILWLREVANVGGSAAANMLLRSGLHFLSSSHNAAAEIALLSAITGNTFTIDSTQYFRAAEECKNLESMVERDDTPFNYFAKIADVAAERDAVELLYNDAVRLSSDAAEKEDVWKKYI